MHIEHFGCSHLLPPLGHVRLGFDERINLLIGPNASGKTTILRAIHGLHMSGTPTSPYAYIEASEDWPRHDKHDPDSAIWDRVPLLYIPATRIHPGGHHVFDPTSSDMESLEAEAPLKSLFDTDAGIFEDQYVESALHYLRRLGSGAHYQQQQVRRAIELGYACSKYICAEVIHDDVPHPYVDPFEERERSELGRTSRYAMGIVTTDDILADPLYAGDLSAGTQGTLLWIWALALKMVNHHGWVEGWENKPAILLIDEIENHLHPTWQRRVIPALLKHFPGLQIFATTHSPFVVAGLKAGQVHLLKRDEEGRVTATTNPEDIVGWTADEILRNMMGVEDPTDDATAAAAKELRQLRNDGPLNNAEAEAERQQRIQELRQKVDRDLLAGGPMAARRQRFEEQFAKTLEEYRRSRDLDQDNG